MPRLRVPTSARPPSEEEAQEAIDFVASRLFSDHDAVKFMAGVVHLMGRGDLGFWLSPRLAKALRSGAASQGVDAASPNSGPVDGSALVGWVLSGGTLDPRIEWDVQPLGNDGAIYRMLLKGAKS